MCAIDLIDLLRINESILKRVDKELTYHGLETAYIVNRILKKLKYKKEEIYNKTVLAFLHDIGAYKTDTNVSLGLYHIIDNKKHSIYGYVLLKHANLFKDDSSILLYHHHSYEYRNNLIDNIEIKDEAFLISLGDIVSLAFSLFKYDEKMVFEYVRNLNKSKFKKIHYDALMELVEEGLIKEIISGKYIKDFYREISSDIEMGKSKIEKYLVLLPISIDFFSFETSIHTMGVYCIARKLCDKLKISNDERKKIEMGALLHDLGKICIPKSILEKGDKLSNLEFKIMKQHVAYTREILEDANIDKEIIDLACSHHEKLDGSGYPRNLTESNISIGGRIITIADIFCALSEKRHYKNEFSKEKVTSIFLEMVEKNQLDKVIVETMINSYDEILEEMVKEKDIFRRALNNMLEEYERIAIKMDNLNYNFV